MRRNPAGRCLSALAKELVENPTSGRKIDFICQEINREINTIGSKNQFTEVGAMVITAKDALGNIREQAFRKAPGGFLGLLYACHATVACCCRGYQPASK